MMESARKGYWKATRAQLQEVARLHVETVNKFKPSCSGFVCNNAKLKDYIASNTDAKSAKQYEQNVAEIRDAQAAKGDAKGVVMKKETLGEDTIQTTAVISGVVAAVAAVIVVVLIILLVRKRRKTMESGTGDEL